MLAVTDPHTFNADLAALEVQPETVARFAARILLEFIQKLCDAEVLSIEHESEGRRIIADVRKQMTPPPPSRFALRVVGGLKHEGER